MAWTEKMVDDLRRLWAEGLTASEIAKKIGVSKNSIVGKVHRLCLKARPSPIKKKDDELEAVEEQILETPEEEIAEEVVELVVVEEVKPEHKKCRSKEHVQLVNLDGHTCRWPIGDPRDDDFCFCGKRVKIGQTYCEEHAAIAYVKPLKK